jgi:hypothetical protein
MQRYNPSRPSRIWRPVCFFSLQHQHGQRHAEVRWHRRRRSCARHSGVLLPSQPSITNAEVLAIYIEVTYRRCCSAESCPCRVATTHLPLSLVFSVVLMAISRWRLGSHGVVPKMLGGRMRRSGGSILYHEARMCIIPFLPIAGSPGCFAWAPSPSIG